MHLLPSRATAKSHLHQEAQGLQSTKPDKQDNDFYIKNIRRNIARLKDNMEKVTNISTILRKNIDKDAFPTSPLPNVKTHDVCYFILENNPKGIGYINLT